MLRRPAASRGEQGGPAVTAGLTGVGTAVCHLGLSLSAGRRRLGQWQQWAAPGL